MNALGDYIAVMEPVRSVERVRFDIETKAQKVADKFFPDDKDKNKVCFDAYILGMFDTLELIYY